MFKTSRTLWVGLTMLALSCACPEKKPVEAPAPPPAATENTPPPPPADTTPPPPSAPPAADTTPPKPTNPPATPAETPKPGGNPAPAAAGLPDKAGAPCDDRGCGGGYQCISYYGIAGPKGPQFKSCEIPCAKASDKCPKGTTCTTIADGPGRVCR
jgi:hypothetical protein